MTDAASKAAEIVTKFRDGVTRHPQIVDGYLKVLTSAIAAAIESAVQDERERAGKLVEAVKALIEAAHGLNSAVCQEFCLSSDTSHQPGHTCAPAEIAAAEAALQAYEVPHE